MYLDPADALRTMARGGRVVVGICGAPGAGKSTFAADVVARLGARERAVEAVVVPMDGFHLSNAQLAAAGLAAVKGAPETFDVAGLVGVLEHVAARPVRRVLAPAYDRALHEPVANRVVVEPSCEVVLVEGNYLGLSSPEWQAAREHLDALWYVHVPWEVRRERLIARHVAGGRTAADASAWVDRVDLANSRLVEASAASADVVLTWGDQGWTFS